LTERDHDSHPEPADPGLSSEQMLLYAEDLARMNASRRGLMRRLSERKPLSAKKVVIADDEATLRTLVSATLASEDYEIIEAVNGVEALALIRAERPQLVLLDVHMPDISGLEICRQIKNDIELGATRVVMLTGAASPEDVAAGESAGADLYLTKPFRPLELLNVIERVMA
jgi:CheY-like chemotaxis protein